MDQIKLYVGQGKIDAAQALCLKEDRPVARLVAKGISRIGRPLEDINTAIENAGRLEVYKLEKNVSILATIAGAAPMIGFLGTVIGMIDSFNELELGGSLVDPSILAGGIWTALLTTAMGLIVAIPALISHYFFDRKILLKHKSTEEFIHKLISIS